MMDIPSIRTTMAAVFWGPNLLLHVAGWVTEPVVSVVISFVFLVSAAGAARFSLDFQRNKPPEVMGFATLGLSWGALVSCVALVWGSLVQYFANPTPWGIIIPISGIVIGSAPVTVLWFSVGSRVLKKAKTGNAQRWEREGPRR